MPAHRGMDAVGADQDVAFGLASRLARRIGEARDDLGAALLEARQAVAGHDGACAPSRSLIAPSNISCSVPREIEICGQR